MCSSGGTGRRPGLKIPWEVIPVPVRPRSRAPKSALLYNSVDYSNLKNEVIGGFFYDGLQSNVLPFSRANGDCH